MRSRIGVLLSQHNEGSRMGNKFKSSSEEAAAQIQRPARFTVGDIEGWHGAWTFSDPLSDREQARRYYADVQRIPLERVYVRSEGQHSET